MGIPGGFGSILFEGLVSAMLYGITTLQTYMYFMHYAEDASTTKFLVIAIWILDSLHISLICHALYYYLITNYDVPTGLEYIVWSFPASLVMNLLMIVAAQFFFAYKIYYLCRPQVKWLVTAPIVSVFACDDNLTSSHMTVIDIIRTHSLRLWHSDSRSDVHQ
ncbi:hypothetical protein PISMIDRAFT_681379 [Pisolithus microcarpus 441]|uniref:Uncharacterized protein n=1 Tax=Pisolithus microcarpus 441 TaxID=765257 RepID=A0A0C9Z5L0_9AGAM|nr:hypothetical protein PISMIDRAFT_681379 [Pisolithus microcarpus 441]